MEELTTQIVQACGLPTIHVAQILALLENYYNGSRFVDRYRHTIQGTVADLPKVYNPTLAFYFLKAFQRDCDYPVEMIDQNLVPDDSKLAYIAAFEEGKPLLEKALLAQEPIVVDTLRRKFGAIDLFSPDLQQDALGVLLCYLGGLTSVNEVPPSRIVLEIPNLVMRKLYAERILAQLVDENRSKISIGNQATTQLFTDGTIGPLCAFVEENLLPVFDNRDARFFNELTIKTLFLTLLHNNQFYLMDSEPELAQQYGDLLMLVHAGMKQRGLYDLFFEFKYVPLKEVTRYQDGPSADAVQKIADGAAVKAASPGELLAVKPIADALADAKKQLEKYALTLQKNHAHGLNLRTFAVISIGMKRILWEEVI